MSESTRPIVLDLFCCEGIGARGYRAAGFDTVGVDLVGKYARRYPGSFVTGDAIQYVRELVARPSIRPIWWDRVALVHLSPPCQGYSVTHHANPEKNHPMLIGPSRDVAHALGVPFVIENVAGALPHLVDPVLLCGSMFGLGATDTDGTPLRLERHRLFETGGWALHQPAHPKHDQQIRVGGVYGGGSANRDHAKYVRRGGYTPAKSVRAALIGVQEQDHTLYGLSQSIPPAYTEWIGRQFLAQHPDVAASASTR